MSSNPLSREQIADLLMAVQGFRPPAWSLLELCSTGHLWETLSKPRCFGLAEKGIAAVLSVLTTHLGVRAGELFKTAASLNPSAAEFELGTAFLDTYEGAIRAGEDPVATWEQAIFVAWLVSRLHPQPQPDESLKVSGHIDEALPPHSPI